MILIWKKAKRRIDNGELADCYWSDYHRALTFVFVKSPVVVRTRRKDIIKKWKKHGVFWRE